METMNLRGQRWGCADQISEARGWGQTGQDTSVIHRVVLWQDLSCHRLEDVHSVDRFVFHESFQKMTLGQFDCQILLCLVTVRSMSLISV